MRLDHRQGVHHDRDIDVMVEAFEVLPRRLAPIIDGIRMGRPIVGLRSYLHVDTIEHRPNSGHHGVKFSPLGVRLQL